MAMKRGSTRFVLFAVAASLGIPSLGLVQAYMGYAGAAAYLLGVYAALAVGKSLAGSCPLVAERATVTLSPGRHLLRVDRRFRPCPPDRGRDQGRRQ